MPMLGSRRKARKMVNIATNEVSGVDYPATGLDGWIVMKARDGHEIVTKRDFSDEKRQELADSGAALPDGGFPIESVGDLKNAIRAIGRASNPTSAKSHIIKRAKALGATDQLPDDWSVSKSDSTNLSVDEILAKADEMAREHNTLVDALDGATYLEDAPDPVRKAVETLAGYLDAEYERDHTGASTDILHVLKSLKDDIAELKGEKMAKGSKSGGSTKDQPDEGTDDDEENDGAGATKDLDDEGEPDEDDQGDGGSTKDQPNKGTVKKADVKKADVGPHAFADDGDGKCKVCGETMPGGMHKENLKKDAMTKDAADSAEDAADSGADESSEGSTVSPSTVHVFVPIGSMSKCKKCGQPFAKGKHKKGAVSKAAISGPSGGNDSAYAFSFTSSDGRVWTSTGSAKSALEVRKEGEMPEIDRDALTDDVRAHVETLEKSLAETQEKLTAAEEKVAKSDGQGNGQVADDDAAEMLKSLPEPMRKRFEEMEAIAKSSAEKLEKAQHESDLREAVSKAREWTHLPGLKPEEFGVSLVALRKSAPEQAAIVEDLFARASAAVKESALLKEIGSGHYDSGGDAMGKLDAMAKESMEKASGQTPRLTYESAFANIINTPEGRALYDEYNRERKESGVR